jgi:hypothetical protein
MPLKLRITIAAVIAVVVILASVTAYKFFNFREEGSVSNFLRMFAREITKRHTPTGTWPTATIP